MENKKIKNRFLWADVIRIVSIYLVVQIHALSVFPDNMLAAVAIKTSVISVPLFVVLSGSLLLSKKETYKGFFKKRIIKVLIPWVIWTIAYMLFDKFIVDAQYISKDIFVPTKSMYEAWFAFFIQAFLSRLWFLPLIFGLYLLTPLLRILAQHTKRYDNIYLLLLWFMSASVLPYILPSSLFPKYEPSLMLMPIAYSGIFLMGYYFIKLKITVSTYLLFVLFCFCLFIQYIPIDYYLIKTFSSVYLDPGTIIASFSAFILLFRLSNYLQRKIGNKTKALIYFFSNVSFGIYLIHEFILYYFRYSYVDLFTMYHLELLFPFVIFLISAIIVGIIQKIPFVRYIVP